MGKWIFTALLLIVGGGLTPAQQRYEAFVPDTLDLADRAGISYPIILKYSAQPQVFNATSILPPDDFSFSTHDQTERPHLKTDDFYFAPEAGCSPKCLESAAFLRVMTGLEQYGELERRILEAYDKRIGEGDLFFIPAEGPFDEPWASIFGQGRMMLAWMAWYQVTDDERIMTRIGNMARAMNEIAVRTGDDAYYPTEPIEHAYYVFALGRSGWKNTDEPKPFHPMYAGQDPTLADRKGHQFDARMGIPAYIGTALRPLPRWYELGGDPAVLELAGRLVRFLTRPEMWQAYEEPPELAGSAHAHYSGHLHAHLIALRAILDYARVTGDTRFMHFVRDGYEYTRTYGIPEIGWYPEWTNNNVGEGCEIADMIALGIRLSELGLGDYWEDVDRAVRNQLIENQHVQGSAEVVGNFDAAAMPNMMRTTDTVAICCTGNCTQALYYAWDSIIKYRDGVAEVNLLLNRASPWVISTVICLMKGRSC